MTTASVCPSSALRTVLRARLSTCCSWLLDIHWFRMHRRFFSFFPGEVHWESVCRRTEISGWKSLVSGWCHQLPLYQQSGNTVQQGSRRARDWAVKYCVMAILWVLCQTCDAITLKGLPHDGEFAKKSQIALRENSHCEFPIAVSRETTVLAC